MNLKSVLLLSALSAAGAANAAIVINQVYGGGGNSGAALKYDYIELFNNGTSTASLSGLSIQYGSAAGNFTGIGAFASTASVKAGGYFLIQLATNSATSTAPTATAAPDATFSLVNLSATTGKVILFNGTTAAPKGTDNAALNANPNKIDLVGFGAGDRFEGTVAAGPSNSTGLRRVVSGVDTNVNGVDFQTFTPTASSFRNSATQAVPEPGTWAALGLGAVAMLRRRRSAK